MWTMNETIQINITIVTCNMLYNYNTKTKTLNKKHRFKLYVALHRGGTVVNLNTSRFQFCFARRLKIVCNNTELIQAKL